jgi:hypothetical protein
MAQWEYRKIDLNDVPSRVRDIDLLDHAGRDGWELVGVTTSNFAYFKRSVPDAGASTEPPLRARRSRATTA